MQCSVCCVELPENAAFCENCGAQGMNPAAGQDSLAEMSAPEDGVQRWMYELNLWRNPTVVITVFKVLALAALAPGLLVLVLGIAEGDGLLVSLAQFIKIYGGLLLVLFLLMIPAYVLVSVINGGRYCVIFEMDDLGVRHTQLQKQYDKAQALGLITALAGALAGSPATMGAGLLAASKQTTYSRFQNVRSITVHHRRHVIYLTTKDLVHNQIYTEKEDFQSVVDHVLNHVPKKSAVRNK